ncbi:E3 ubiquitin-protein ligase RNF216-like, partial [Asbolus verrucosus]
DGQYPKRHPVNVEPDVFPENQLEILTEFLPDADPDYLKMMYDRFEGKPDLVTRFINEVMEGKDCPTKKEYQRRQQLSAQQKQYTTEFTVENFIKLIPDPHAFFSDSSRTVKMDDLSCHYALVFLCNTFHKLPIRVVESTFKKNSCKLYKTFKELQTRLKRSFMLKKRARKPIEMPNTIQNIPLLQEIAYCAHEKEINEYLDEIKNKEEAERREAVSQGLMKTCGCCYDEAVLPRDIFSCENGCSFCKSCIVKSTEVLFGEGKLDFPCLMNCPSYFSLQTLQVLSAKLFSKIAQKKALEEIKSAGINELEMCPFCDFATIPAEGYNIFSCLNPECMKESCRLCKEPSHAPLRCEEIEKDENVRARTFVENKMTEALLKTCWKCGIKFFKEEGCNRMTCSCGAKMCYVCNQPVTGYKHFNENGGDRYDLCPLYSDTVNLNKENVLKGAEVAKAEIDKTKLKYDPTRDIHQHYKDRAKKVPQTQV